MYLKEPRGPGGSVGSAGVRFEEAVRGSAADRFAARSAADGYRAGRSGVSALASRAAAAAGGAVPADLSGRIETLLLTA
jgi:hypothetical protein